MTTRARTQAICSRIVLLAGLTSGLTFGGEPGSADSRSPADLVAFLTYQAGRERESDTAGFFTCGKSTESVDRAAAVALSKMGERAVPTIKAAFDSADGSELPINTVWLLLAVARIEGPAGYEWIQQMSRRPGAFSEGNIDMATALALGLTSFVSTSRFPGIQLWCTRAEEPRAVLDEMINAWERDDRTLLEKTLGPDAREALRSLLKGRDWSDVRRDLWGSGSPEGAAIGYRFKTPGRWAEPDETLDDESPPWAEGRTGAFDLSVAFTTRTGTSCETRGVRFLGVARGLVVSTYLVDAPDLEGLLRSIAVCAAQTGEGR